MKFFYTVLLTVFCLTTLSSRLGGESLLLESGAASATNMGWGGVTVNGKRGLAPLQVENNIEPSAPYFAEFDFKLNRAGKYAVWAQVLGCEARWVSPFSWKIDDLAAAPAKALPGSTQGAPRWIKLGEVKLSSGAHKLRFQLTGRRTHPDDAYIFALYQTLIVPAGKPVNLPKSVIDLGFNPQVNRNASDNRAENPVGNASGYSRLTGDNADPVALRINLTGKAVDVAPIWRDYSEGGMVTAPDFFIPELVKPLRPRIIRKDHCLPLGKKNADGKVELDFTRLGDSVKAIRGVGAEPIIGLEVPGVIMPRTPQGYIAPQSQWRADKEFFNRWRDLLEKSFDYLRDNHLEVNYFQSFNEPEFSGFINDPQLAIDVFAVASETVRRRRPDAKMLGIGCGDGISVVWQTFINYLGDHPNAVDYFDYHTYQASPDYYRNRLVYLRGELAKRKLNHIKPAITEWGAASSGIFHHRSGMANVIYNTETAKALSEAGLEIGCLFCIRDFPKNYLKFGLITTDGFLKPSYWGQWLWAQLPDGKNKLEVKGAARDGVNAVAFRTDDGGVAVLMWRGGERRDPVRQIELAIDNAPWKYCYTKTYLLDEDRHIGFVAPGRQVELPFAESYGETGKSSGMVLKFQMRPLSMRLMKIAPADGIRPTDANLRNQPLLFGELKP
ncbi:MAG: hypothetical protein PHI35_01545 [Victivallaceae bacterium]|nr:hypothetical protein [Victivallaceae bacterium]